MTGGVFRRLAELTWMSPMGLAEPLSDEVLVSPEEQLEPREQEQGGQDRAQPVVRQVAAPDEGP